MTCFRSKARGRVMRRHAPSTGCFRPKIAWAGSSVRGRTVCRGNRARPSTPAEDRLGWFIGPGPHGVPRESREAIYAFFIKYLNQGKGDPREEVAILDPLEKILC